RASFAAAAAAFEADLAATFKALIRSGKPSDKGKQARTSRITHDGGWFDGAGRAPDVARDPAVLSEEDLARYVAAFSRTGFRGADAWYVNGASNLQYGARLPDRGVLRLPVLFFHAAYDVVCETLESRLAEPMRRDCTDLSERIFETGHWLVQERPKEFNEALAAWLSERFEAPGQSASIADAAR
ncbi:MAG: alpha/beta hydrolase, partial [Candidatus Eremiobacteraeota bacterium]|nr:alpha/beta hydrolase [Candidatus Eremiobacteraeota bacterium]